MTIRKLSMAELKDLDDKEVSNIGYQFMRGAFRYIGQLCLLVWIFILAFHFIGPYTGLFPADDCDASIWSRCGMRVLTDHKTGIQYLETPDGAIIERGHTK